MNTTIAKELREVTNALHYSPAISIIMPFEPKMASKKKLTHSLKCAVDKIERELLDNYPEEIFSLMMQKLRNIIDTLNYNTYTKSLAIYVSPVFEKVLYLNLLLDERVIIKESFSIRDLVYYKKQLQQFLILTLSANHIEIYEGNDNKLVKIISNSTESILNNYTHNTTEKVANFSDKNNIKEIEINKILHFIDNSLNSVLKAYPYPLFILAPKKIAGYFKKTTKHSKAIIKYVPGNFDNASIQDLKETIGHFTEDWQQIKEQNLLNQIERAASQKKLLKGIKEVWKGTANGKLLIVEKGFIYPAQHGSTDEIIYKAIEPYNTFSYIKDAVDEIIERVLENGGDVEFVDKELLKDYNHIALIKYY